MKWSPWRIRKVVRDAEQELYALIDKNIRELPKNEDGTYDTSDSEYHNDDVDALRHAYVSGVFVLEYSEGFSNFLGVMQEYFPFARGSNPGPNDALEINMDLWNNYIGRKYALNATSRLELFNLLLKALRNGELITNLKDPRIYSFFQIPRIHIKGTVLVVEESKTGENLIFYDPSENLVMTKTEFARKIREGLYPFYEIRIIDGKEVPVSKKDGAFLNNLD